MRKTLFAPALAVLSVFLAFGVGEAASPRSGGSAGARIAFQIAAQPLNQALNAFAQQADLRIVFDTAVAEGVSAPDVNGSLTAERALTLLLAKSKLSYQFMDERTVAVTSTVQLDSEGHIARNLRNCSGFSSDKVNSPPSLNRTGSGKSSNGWTGLAAKNGCENENHQGNVALARVEGAEGVQPVQPNDGEAGLNSNLTDENKISEIIVTAQKREERLQEVPISITVLDGERLAGGTVDSLRDALVTVPGVSGYENFQAGGMTKYSVRGVTSNSSLFNGGAVVGFYLDETPFSFVRFPVSPDVNVYDLERVELLRGPQGTLYGASSLNGVVRVMTRSANLNEFELTARGTVSSTVDGRENYRTDAAINIPLIPGKFALRAVAGYSDDGGWIDSTTTGKKDINGVRDENLRLKLRAAPTENLDLQLTSWFRRSDGDGYNTSYDNRTWSQGSALVPNEPREMELDSHNLTLTYNFADFSILSSTSYLTYRNDSHLVSGASFNDDLLTRLKAESLTQEIRATSTADGPWQWSLGGMYREAEDESYQDLLLNSFGASASGINRNIYTSDSYSVFGELTRSLFNEHLKLTAGLRYFHDETSANELSAFNPAQALSGFDENTSSAVTPRFVVRYIPTTNVNLYASYSEGFRSGFTLSGFSQLVAPPGFSVNVKPDRLHNYEIGSKGGTSDGFLTYEVAVYYMDWQDAVQAVNRQIPGTSLGGFAAFNAESASGYGVDFAVILAPTDQLRLGATVSWNDLHFDEAVLSAGTVLYQAGSRLNESPEWTVGPFANYDFELGGDYAGVLSVSGNYTSRIGFGGFPNQTYGDNLFTAQTSFALKSPQNWDLTFFIDNVTDEDGAVRFGAFIPNSGDRFRPRTIGLQMNFRM